MNVFYLLMETSVLTSTKPAPGMDSQVIKSFAERPVISSDPHWSPITVTQPAVRGSGPRGLVMSSFCLLCDLRM